LYPLASFLHNLIHNSIPKQFSHICNSYHLVNELSGQLLQTGCELVSLDVVSLSSNVPIELINDSIVRRWNFISGVTSMPMEEFCLRSAKARRDAIRKRIIPINYILYYILYYLILMYCKFVCMIWASRALAITKVDSANCCRVCLLPEKKTHIIHTIFGFSSTY